MIIKADIFARAARYCRYFDIRINLDVLLFKELHGLLVARLVDVPENDGSAETTKLKEKGFAREAGDCQRVECSVGRWMMSTSCAMRRPRPLPAPVIKAMSSEMRI